MTNVKQSPTHIIRFDGPKGCLHARSYILYMYTIFVHVYLIYPSIYTFFEGILAGVWPCGKITMIGELFGSESLSQVFGFLHTFLFENLDSLKNMSEYIHVLIDVYCCVHVAVKLYSMLPIILKASQLIYASPHFCS